MKMTTLKRALCSLAFLCLTLTTSFAATELLYVQEGHKIVTYSVNNTTAVTKKLGTLNTAYSATSPITVYRSGSFLYVLGFSPAQEYFTVYSLTAAGVPNATPVQTLFVKPALSHFNIHPNGTIAYAMFSWEEIVDGNDEWASDIVLFTINPTTGKLTNTTKAVANFPLSDYSATFGYGMSDKGTKLFVKTYDEQDDFAPQVYSYLTVNATTGALGKPIEFWEDESGPGAQYSAFSDQVIAQLTPDYAAPMASIDIYLTSGDLVHPLITCTSAMVPECGDTFGYYGPWIHSSGKYLFFPDMTTNEVPILYINTNLSKLQASGDSIPGNPKTVAFSPDGLLVYAVEGSEVLVYVFNPHSGLLTAHTTITAAGVGQILPAR
jgi:6-phosphogluconolactonase (cycloisomerase 2 family)